MNRRKIVVNEKEGQDSRWQDYKEVWINKWNIICVKIVAIISFSCIISLILVKIAFAEEPNNNDNSTKKDLRTMDESNFRARSQFPLTKLSNEYKLITNECYVYEGSYWDNEKRCFFNCYQIHVLWISSKINSGYEINKCSGAIKLNLIEVLFNNRIMEKNWLTVNIPVAHISIEKCHLEDIEEGAFDTRNFQKTITLTFLKSQIAYYRKNMFTNFEGLSDFSVSDTDLSFPPSPLYDPNSGGVKFEFGVLENFKDTLTTLQVGRSLINPEAIRNLTGIKLSTLKIIDFRFNENLTTIPINSFNAPSLETLHLTSNALIDIPENAFINAPNIGIIYLNKNKLETLHKNTFLSLKKHTRISISENKWSCDCNIHFLTTLYKNIEDLDLTKCNDGTFLKEIFQSCTHNPSSTPTTVQPPTTAEPPTTLEPPTTVQPPITLEPPTTEQPPSTKQPTTTVQLPTISTPVSPTEVTKSSSSSETTITTSAAETSSTTKKVSFPSQTQTCHSIQNYHFKLEETETTVEIVYTGNVSSAERLLLFTSDNNACNLEDKKGIINKEDTSYIMCKQSNDNDLECFSGRSKPVYEQQAWLCNGERIHVFLIGSAVAVATSILTGIGVFYYIRKHPKLLKSNKRIAFVRTPPNEVVVLPQKPRSPVYLMPYPKEHNYFQEVSYLPVRDAPYLTPISQRYMKVQENYDRPGLKRSLSDLSMKTVASYVTENQFVTGSIRSRRPVLDEPPPLPPPRNRYEEVVVHERDFRNRSTQYW